MKKFGTWLARTFLRPTESFLWVTFVVIWVSLIPSIGVWWVFLGMVGTSLPVSALEAWWNDYADDYSDLEEE